MKKLAIVLVVFLTLALLAGIIFSYRNTSFIRSLFKIGINQEDIKNNNSTSQGALEFEEKVVSVPNHLKISTFQTERKLFAPKKFDISVFYTGLNKPRGMDFDENGNLYVAEMGANRIIVFGISLSSLLDPPTAGYSVIDTDLNSVSSVDYYNKDIYVAAMDKVVVYKNIQPTGTYSEKKVLVDNLPIGGHSTRTVVIGPDEKMYVSIGSSCNICEESDNRRAAVVRYNLDGTGEEIFATGLRNSVGINFYLNQKTNKSELWAVDNGRDLIGDDLPPEEVNILEEGKNYGWPFCYGAAIANPEYSTKAQYCKDSTVKPAFEMQAHSAPLSIQFVPSNSKIPESLKNKALIAFHGSWNRTTPTGYKIVFVDPTNKGGKEQNLITGWLGEDGKPWGRPVDIEFNGKGNMYISDDYSGSIYKVTFD